MIEQNSLEKSIEDIAEKFLESIKNKEIYIISHFDTDGITSAVIMIQALKKLDARFSLKIVKSLDEITIMGIPRDKVVMFLDLSSGSMNYIEKAKLTDVFVIDHHEIVQDIPKGINVINPELHGKYKVSSSCLTYLFCKKINSENKELAKLAILGMIGDTLEKEINFLSNTILKDGDIQKKRGLIIYPSTRPLNRVLEFCSNPYIPDVTGNTEGVFSLLKEAGLSPVNGKYKTLLELEETEMTKLITSVLLKNPKHKTDEIVGDIFLIKLFNKIEDAREISAMINACSRLKETDTAIQLCMEIPKVKKKAEAIYVKYKQHIISALKTSSEIEKIPGEGFVIINAKERIKDTLIGTITSILSRSNLYKHGTVIISMAYYDEFIKISARGVGKSGRNVREILNKVISITGGEVGGHENAAGGIIKKEKENEFINLLKKNLEIEVVTLKSKDISN